MRGEKNEKKKMWLLLFFMVVATDCYYENVYRISSTFVPSKSKATENIFNLQEWHQNTKTFISYKTFTIGKKN